uniref:Retrotransposon protein, putative, unclassified n=1 Tax=Oryza sativa subsp. japonica TaxID=39947 RepID=Q2QMN3_ORYSJ|nr:retrotransposon protein, putative, unclassified [Oryza sativa Japonica Group]
MGHTYLHSIGSRCDVGARLSVQSDVTGVRPVTDRSLILTISRQFSTPHVCPTALNATGGSWGAARIKGSSAWAPSSLAPPAKRRLGEGLGAKQCKGPRA